MQPTRVVLVRHGQSLGQQRRIVSGHVACKGLSDRGRAQVEALRDRLAAGAELAGATALYASLMARAVETAQLLSPALDGLPVRRECDFCENHPGESSDGLPVDEYERRYPVPETWTPDSRRAPDGESWNEMSVRVARGLDALVERHRGETVVVACHGGVVVHSMVRWLRLDAGVPTGRAWLDPGNASITEWRFAPTPSWRRALPIELVRFNDRAHLTAAGDPPTPAG